MVKVFNGKLTNQKTGRQQNLQHLHLKATHQKDTQNRKIYPIKEKIQLAAYANKSSLSSIKYQSSIDWEHQKETTQGRGEIYYLLVPGESQGRRSLVGCRLWSHTESDTTEATQQQQQQQQKYNQYLQSYQYFQLIVKKNEQSETRKSFQR